MYKTISNEIIRTFHPCYDPSKVITDETEELAVKQWVEKYKDVLPAKDIIWLLCRGEFLSEKDLRLFAVWCAREALKLIEKPDERSIDACNVAEKFANGEATKDELLAARDAAYIYADAAYVVYASAYAADEAANAAAYAAYAAYAAASTADNPARTAAYYAANYADNAASTAANAYYYAAIALQIDKLLSYFD